MPQMREVYSSNVRKIGHDPQTGELHVQWENGRTSVYGDAETPVPADVAKQVMNSASVGKAVHNLIKPTYSHRYL